MDEPPHLLLRGCEGGRRQGCQLRNRRRYARQPLPARLAEGFAACGRHGYSGRLHGEKRLEPCQRPQGFAARRYTDLWRIVRRWRTRCRSPGQQKMMRIWIRTGMYSVLVVAAVMGQTAPAPAPPA